MLTAPQTRTVVVIWHTIVIWFKLCGLGLLRTHVLSTWVKPLGLCHTSAQAVLHTDNYPKFGIKGVGLGRAFGFRIRAGNSLKLASSRANTSAQINKTLNQGLDCKYLVVGFRASVSQDTNHQSIHLPLYPAKLISGIRDRLWIHFRFPSLTSIIAWNHSSTNGTIFKLRCSMPGRPKLQSWLRSQQCSPPQSNSPKMSPGITLVKTRRHVKVPLGGIPYWKVEGLFKVGV